MPANLSHTYLNAEKKFRRASTAEEELQCLELMLREIPKHKGTDKLQADLKKRISQTKAKLQQSSAKKSSAGFRIPRQGAARIVVAGGANVGKSTLCNWLADSSLQVAEYPFTTTQPQPAVMNLGGVKVQLIDTPPIAPGELDPRTESLIRGADLVLLLCDLENDEAVEHLLECVQTLQESQTRLGLENAIDENDIGVTYTQFLPIWTKADAEHAAERKELFVEHLAEQPKESLLDASRFLEVQLVDDCQQLLEELKTTMLEKLKLVRVFTKNPGEKEIVLEDPIGLSRGSTVLDLAEFLHEELKVNFHHAKVWGQGKHDGTVVAGDYALQDHDTVEIHTR